ncbi:MAG: hypothetical protein KDK71_01675 [Chlamydiia bacterium]|nr:hypothetical protein [Chlamydiia bacterium]
MIYLPLALLPFAYWWGNTPCKVIGIAWVLLGGLQVLFGKNHLAASYDCALEELLHSMYCQNGVHKIHFDELENLKKHQGFDGNEEALYLKFVSKIVYDILPLKDIEAEALKVFCKQLGGFQCIGEANTMRLLFLAKHQEGFSKQQELLTSLMVRHESCFYDYERQFRYVLINELLKNENLNQLIDFTRVDLLRSENSEYRMYCIANFLKVVSKYQGKEKALEQLSAIPKEKRQFAFADEPSWFHGDMSLVWYCAIYADERMDVLDTKQSFQEGLKAFPLNDVKPSDTPQEGISSYLVDKAVLINGKLTAAELKSFIDAARKEKDNPT